MPDKIICQSLEIRELIKERRRLRQIWHRTRHPADKTAFNRASNDTRKAISDARQKSLEQYLEGLSPLVDKDYSLWKATRRFKRPCVQIPPLKNQDGQWICKDQEKAELFAQIIMLQKPGKPPNEVSSYRPMSLLPSISKLFEKLLLKRLKPLIEDKIHDIQFGFRNKHATIEQVHRVTTEIERALEEKKFCSTVFLDVSQAF